MDYFDEAINKTKEAFGVAKQKTTEAVNKGKQKYEIAVLERELEKLYNELGKITYSELKNDESVQGNIRKLINTTEKKYQEIKKAREELLKSKNKRVCPQCAATIEEDSAYCNFCGAKVTFTE